MEKRHMVQIESIINSWDIVSNYLSVPETEKEYDRLVEIADYLVDTVGANDNHKLSRLMDTIFLLISTYDKINRPEPVGDPIECLKYLKS